MADRSSRTRSPRKGVDDTYAQTRPQGEPSWTSPSAARATRDDSSGSLRVFASIPVPTPRSSSTTTRRRSSSAGRVRRASSSSSAGRTPAPPSSNALSSSSNAVSTSRASSRSRHEDTEKPWRLGRPSSRGRGPLDVDIEVFAPAYPPAGGGHKSSGFSSGAGRGHVARMNASTRSVLQDITRALDGTGEDTATAVGRSEYLNASRGGQEQYLNRGAARERVLDALLPADVTSTPSSREHATTRTSTASSSGAAAQVVADASRVRSAIRVHTLQHAIRTADVQIESLLHSHERSGGEDAHALSDALTQLRQSRDAAAAELRALLGASPSPLESSVTANGHTPVQVHTREAGVPLPSLSSYASMATLSTPRAAPITLSAAPASNAMFMSTATSGVGGGGGHSPVRFASRSPPRARAGSSAAGEYDDDVAHASIVSAMIDRHVRSHASPTSPQRASAASSTGGGRFIILSAKPSAAAPPARERVRAAAPFDADTYARVSAHTRARTPLRNRSQTPSSRTRGAAAPSDRFTLLVDEERLFSDAKAGREGGPRRSRPTAHSYTPERAHMLNMQLREGDVPHPMVTAVERARVLSGDISGHGDSINSIGPDREAELLHQRARTDAMRRVGHPRMGGRDQEARAEERSVLFGMDAEPIVATPEHAHTRRRLDKPDVYGVHDRSLSPARGGVDTSISHELKRSRTPTPSVVPPPTTALSGSTFTPSRTLAHVRHGASVRYMHASAQLRPPPSADITADVAAAQARRRSLSSSVGSQRGAADVTRTPLPSAAQLLTQSFNQTPNGAPSTGSLAFAQWMQSQQPLTSTSMVQPHYAGKAAAAGLAPAHPVQAPLASHAAHATHRARPARPRPATSPGIASSDI